MPAMTPGHSVSPPSASDAPNSTAPSAIASTATVACIGGGRPSARGAGEARRSIRETSTGSASTIARKPGDSTQSNDVPSKSTPTSPLASAPVRSGGRNGRTPVAPASPAPWPMSNARDIAGGRCPGRYAPKRHDDRRPPAALDLAGSRALRGALRLAYARHEVLGDARHDVDHDAARGDLVCGRP